MAESRRTVSRAPVLVLLLGLGLAVTLVLIGAALAATPAGRPAIARPGTPAAPRDVNVIMRDYRFDPTPLYLVEGETVRFNVINGGLVAHEFVLGDDGVQQAWAAANARATPPAPLATAPPASVPPTTGGVRLLLDSGASTSITYEVSATDGLRLVCHLPGHVEQGMIGRVELVSR